jgi:3-deoxy-D-manno-octulosonic-acid transferase
VPQRNGFRWQGGWRAYGALIEALSWLHYVVLSPLGKSDEGGADWLAKRHHPVLPKPTEAHRIWIHAVSAGESKVAELLRHELLALDPALSVVLSSTTYSGHSRVKRAAGEEASFIMPLDTPAEQSRLFERLKPRLLVLVESEYWPAQFVAAAAAGVPVVVVNATLSARSFARHRRFPAIARRTLLQARRIYPQDADTLARYRELGVPADRLELAGNLKLAPLGNLPPPDRSRPTITFGNLHADELDALAPAIVELHRRRPARRILIVPRYPGRIPPAELQRRFGPDLAVVEDLAATEAPLVWLDRMGALAAAYAQSELGIVCGTFAPIGGHDLSEPLQLGAASLYGPHVERQRALDLALKGMQGAVQVASAAELPDAVLALLDHPAERDAMVARYRSLSEAAAIRLREVAAGLIAIAQ